MASNTEVLKWQRFFTAAGVPSSVALKYSKSFAEQRMQFTMLEALDKSVLIELGIVTVGDQIAILQYIRKLKSGKEKVSCDPSSMETDSIATEKGQKSTPLAPDHDDIYHVHLPVGATPKTRAILQKHNMLKSAGLLKRGSSGIRQSGKDVLPLKKQNNAARPSGTTGSKYCVTSMAASSEVSSTTDELYGRLGIKGLVSDQLRERRLPTGTRVNASSSSNLFERAVNESASDRAAEPVFRVRLSGMGTWNRRNRINNPATQPRVIGGIRKQKIQSNTLMKNTARLTVNTRRIFGRGRPSVFNRLS